nr:MAG TPA: hypothetical protein [Caudoviricetes sp.]DAY87728.1 MAG TPA: hypothetical protein [Caudoviricetes sp.]
MLIVASHFFSLSPGYSTLHYYGVVTAWHPCRLH